jgi:hypothetical protein
MFDVKICNLDAVIEFDAVSITTSLMKTFPGVVAKKSCRPPMKAASDESL